jgi:energy-coupling factor transport system ATP-binding protein
VEAELAFGPENLGEARETIRDRIGEVAARVAIPELLGRETAALSGGERQLLAAAGILMMRPRLYVVDEPLANLDPATASRLIRLLRELADQGHGVVIVEHRVEEALELRPDRVLSMDDGRAVYHGDVAGFLEVADPHAVKLPFEVVLAHTRRDLAVGGARPPGGASPASGPQLRSPSAGRPPDGRANIDGMPGAANPTADREAARRGNGEVPRLEYRGVHAGYDGREVLRGVDAAFGRREVVAVLGPNGSGKTTLFRTAMRLMRPTAGSILVEGDPIERRSVAELATEFGYVFQSPSQMLFARTVREELLFGPRNLGRDPATFDGLISDVLDRTALAALDGILERPPLTLSFGQQKRLAIAIALALQPSALILDEPSAGQDHRTATEFMAEVQAIPGLESLYLVTHDVDLALTHADRILLLRDGRMVADGPPAVVIEDEDRWLACNLRLTSLLRANARWRQGGGRLLDAETLARRIVTEEERAEGGASRGSA